ncbi:MAG: acyl-CoA thioesterase [Lutimonas sp.]
MISTLVLLPLPANNYAMHFSVNFKTRWSDFDPNNHMRHSAYNDYAAESRVRFFAEHGLSLMDFNKENVGPILFTENTSFFREVSIGEDIKVELTLKGLSDNGKKFKFLHRIFRPDGELAAEIEVYGAWLDLKKRKVTIPPEIILNVVKDMDKSENFEVIS